jgi:hypothetical protein
MFDGMAGNNPGIRMKNATEAKIYAVLCLNFIASKNEFPSQGLIKFPILMSARSRLLTELSKQVNPSVYEVIYINIKFIYNSLNLIFFASFFFIAFSCENIRSMRASLMASPQICMRIRNIEYTLFPLQYASED